MRQPIIKSWHLMRANLNKTVRKIKFSNHAQRKITTREDLVLQGLQVKLGKSKHEVKGMISDGLMSVLTMVPFTHTIQKD